MGGSVGGSVGSDQRLAPVDVHDFARDVGGQVGNEEEGKVADLIVSDGDPLEVTSHVQMVFIGGKSVSLDTRQKRLADKYAAAPNR